jgi:hypothetical protein
MTQYGTWVSYGGDARIWLALGLLAVAGGATVAALRLPLPVRATRPEPAGRVPVRDRDHHAAAPAAVADGAADQGHVLFLRADAGRVRPLGPVRIRLPVGPAPHRAERRVEDLGLRHRPHPVPAPAARARADTPASPAASPAPGRSCVRRCCPAAGDSGLLLGGPARGRVGQDAGPRCGPPVVVSARPGT